MSQFEFGFMDEGRRRRDEGIDRVLANTPEDFAESLADAFWTLFDSGDQFTAEDARFLSGDPPDGVHPNSFGGLWRDLLKEAGDRLEIVDHVTATRPSAQGRDLKVYRRIKKL